MWRRGTAPPDDGHFCAESSHRVPVEHCVDGSRCSKQMPRGPPSPPIASIRDLIILSSPPRVDANVSEQDRGRSATHIGPLATTILPKSTVASFAVENPVVRSGHTALTPAQVGVDDPLVLCGCQHALYPGSPQCLEARRDLVLHLLDCRLQLGLPFLQFAQLDFGRFDLPHVTCAQFALLARLR